MVSYPWAAANSRPWATNSLFQEHRQVKFHSPLLQSDDKDDLALFQHEPKEHNPALTQDIS